jgi:hypothetical protein
VAVLLVPVCLFLVALAAATVASAANERLQNGLLRKPAGKVVTAIADELTDVDRDGFGVGGRMLDPDPRDARVFPYAVDRPGNEVDEDGLAGDLPAGTAAYAESRVPAPWRRHPDVVFVVLESFRFDLVGSRFGGRPVTPVLDALAARGVASRAAYSHNGYTAQSRFHFMSGSLAGVSDGTTLIDDFRANGYTTVYVSGQDESFGGARYQVGFDRADVAFDARAARDRRYSTFATAGSLAVPLAVVDEHVADALAHRVPADKPLFLYVNFHDTHFPYTHDGITTVTSDVRVPRGGIIPDARPQIWATYANTAANVDRAVGQVLERVRAARGREAAVVVTADHGESLFDGDFLGHGHALDDVQTRVPLIAVDLPLVIAEPFGHVDLRDAIGAALSIPAAEPSAPRLDASSGREVFQYLGHINRPRQIALRSVDGGITYDFRRRQVRRPGREWVRPANLSPADRRDFERLVHEWERMMLARETRGLHG